MEDITFTNGLIVKPPSDAAKHFLFAKVSIKSDEFIAFLENHTKPDGWVNIDIKWSNKKPGTLYGALNQWTKDAAKEEPAQESPKDDIADSIPF